jgi:hypothetical protein
VSLCQFERGANMHCFMLRQRHTCFTRPLCVSSRRDSMYGINSFLHDARYLCAGNARIRPIIGRAQVGNVEIMAAAPNTASAYFRE